MHHLISASAGSVLNRQPVQLRLRSHHEVRTLERIVDLHLKLGDAKVRKIADGHGSCRSNKEQEKGCCPIERSMRDKRHNEDDADEEDTDTHRHGYVPYHEVGKLNCAVISIGVFSCVFGE